MMLNSVKGNMYDFCTHTWNAIKGRCPHDCAYCYMKRFKQNPIRLDRKEFKTDLGEGNFIFVGSSCDMWADKIPYLWIKETIKHAIKYKNKYLFQSKNPRRFANFLNYIPNGSILGTTIETNRTYPQMGDTPDPEDRADILNTLSNYYKNYKTMVTIEPIFDFDLEDLVELIILCNPEWVNIGADSKNSGLIEPSAKKINKLIKNLKMSGIEVKIKSNLKRLTK